MKETKPRIAEEREPPCYSNSQQTPIHHHHPTSAPIAPGPDREEGRLGEGRGGCGDGVVGYGRKSSYGYPLFLGLVSTKTFFHTLNNGGEPYPNPPVHYLHTLTTTLKVSRARIALLLLVMGKKTTHGRGKRCGERRRAFLVACQHFCVGIWNLYSPAIVVYYLLQYNPRAEGMSAMSRVKGTSDPQVSKTRGESTDLR